MIEVNPDRTDMLIDALTTLWEASVRATHHFLTEDGARKFGFKNLYLSTDHIGYYEKYGFYYISDGYHSWDEHSRIYKIDL